MLTEHYVISFVTELGAPWCHEARLPAADLSKPQEKARVKAQLLADCFNLDEIAARSLDAFESGHVIQADSKEVLLDRAAALARRLLDKSADLHRSASAPLSKESRMSASMNDLASLLALLGQDASQLLTPDEPEKLGPVIACAGPLQVAIAGYGYQSPALEQIFASGEPTRYDDIHGPGVMAVTEHCGWAIASPAIRVVVLDEKAIVAAGWCGKIRDDQSGRRGLNFTYAVHADHEGNGLALIAAAGAFTALAQEDANLSKWPDLNIQCRASNSASAALAQRLGFQRRPARDFVADLGGGVQHQYLGFASTHEAFTQRAQEILARFEDSACDTTAPSQRQRMRG